MRVLVTGATGYIGGRLVARLVDEGHQVRVLVRRPEKLADKPWAPAVEVAVGDASDEDACARAMDGCDVAYYLLHSLSGESGFGRAEEQMARSFRRGAVRAGIRRIVYLGGLVDPDARVLSEHLQSRRRVGEVLRDGPIDCIELRAAVIIGSGSASFEMLRYLAERLPVMTTPSWVRTRIQPIAVRDVLTYLSRALDVPEGVSRAFDIGGPDVLTYEQMMQRYARIAGLNKRLIVRVPILSPGLSSHWVGLITPVPASIARPLVDSLRHEVVCREHDIAEFIPDWPLLGFDEAVRLALEKVRDEDVVTRWSDRAWPGAPDQPWPGDPSWSGGSLYTDVRELHVAASVDQAWDVIEGIGGENGWYSWKSAWQLRGLMDRAVGGVGLRRGRRNPDRLAVGDALDFWRVEERRAPTLLRLRAEMRLPGLAWLEWQLTDEPGGCRIRQRALFHPRGLAGHAYWASVTPFHAFVFAPMLKAIAREAERRTVAARVTPARVTSGSAGPERARAQRDDRSS